MNLLFFDLRESEKEFFNKHIYPDFNITFRELKKVITALREDYAIVSKETDGGGYWIAESEDDILDFIQMIERRKTGYENTLKSMYDFLADYGNIPYVD